MSKKSRSYVFEANPKIYKSRSKFDLSYGVKTMFNAGDIVPIYIQEIYPGDTFKDKSTMIVRTTAPFVRVPMDNLFLDTYFFFIPNRLTYDKWSAVMGENKASYWAPTAYAEVPIVKLPGAGQNVDPLSIASYFGLNIPGLPVGSTEAPIEVSALPFRANALVYNEWFRNQNVQAPVLVNTGDWVGTAPSINANDWAVDNILGLCPKANKLADYFTSCLPAPQKGAEVDIPLNDSPVIPGNVDNTNLLNDDDDSLYGLRGVTWDSMHGEWNKPSSTDKYFLGIGFDVPGNVGVGYTATESDYFNVAVDDIPKPVLWSPSNLIALNDNLASINDLRFAFALQRMLEKDARGGTRYREYLLEHFGVLSPDARMQIPEFLGGKRIPLSWQQINQTSSSTEASPLGQVSANSLSVGRAGFSKGFVEHGFVIGYAIVRQKHTYQQGIERFWTRKSRYDFYDPTFAFIGEQPVFKYEIMATNKGAMSSIFGYNEAWADLRYRPSKITGELNTLANSGFDIWHFADYYENVPTLSSTWMKETPAYIDRALSVASTTAPQFIADIWHKQTAVRVMPVYSVPGLVDHA